MKNSIQKQVWDKQMEQAIITPENKKLKGETFDAYMKRMQKQRENNQGVSK